MNHLWDCHDTAPKNARVRFTGRKKRGKQENGYRLQPPPNLRDKTRATSAPALGPQRPVPENQALSEKLLH